MSGIVVFSLGYTLPIDMLFECPVIIFIKKMLLLLIISIPLSYFLLNYMVLMVQHYCIYRIPISYRYELFF